eukprot:jgi/Ulvmu1/6184/UM028_0040.1
MIYYSGCDRWQSSMFTTSLIALLWAIVPGVSLRFTNERLNTSLLASRICRTLLFFVLEFHHCTKSMVWTSGLQVDLDTLLIDHRPLDCPQGILAVVHKPVGYTCSHDPREGPLVYDLLPQIWLRRKPAVASVGRCSLPTTFPIAHSCPDQSGVTLSINRSLKLESWCRLDKCTSGLLLVTTLTEMVHKLTSPKHHVSKRYHVTLEEPLSLPEQQAMVAQFESGQLRLHSEDRPCRPAQLQFVGCATAVVWVTEGKYHQVRRMFAACGAHVINLHRGAFGALDLAGLGVPEGSWARLPLDTMI